MIYIQVDSQQSAEEKLARDKKLSEIQEKMVDVVANMFPQEGQTQQLSKEDIEVLKKADIRA
jgi:hypothetical protein